MQAQAPTITGRDLFPSAANGAVVLTANKRLARQLVSQYDQWQLASGLRTWSPPAITSLAAWVNRQLEALRRESALLTDIQLQHSWETVLASDPVTVDRRLLHLPQAARLAREAHLLLETYQVNFSAQEGNEDQIAFLRWRSAWVTRAEQEGWLDRSRALHVVIDALARGALGIPAQFILAGFDDLNPLVSHLCNILADRGSTVRHWKPEHFTPQNMTVRAYADMSDEVRACACWIRQTLTEQPDALIGIVAPQMADYQMVIERIFRAEFDPSGCLTGDDGPEPFTLSLGTALAGEGVACAALRLLALSDPVRFEDVSWLLRSPYFLNADSEWAARAKADVQMRSQGRAVWPLDAMLKSLRRIAGFGRFADALGKVMHLRKARQLRLPGSWAEHFIALLEHSGWPGRRRLTSREFQAASHVKGLFTQLASLDRVSKAITYLEALDLLRRLAKETIFQPEGPETRVQVLGMLEAAGFTFNALWMVGAHSGAFPATPRPNPFVPIPLQSLKGMPHADFRREHEFALGMKQRLLGSAPHVVVSWPRHHEGSDLRPSPLMQDLPTLAPEYLASVAPGRAINTAAPCLETIVDDRAAALTTHRPWTGGTGILKDQALCPFRAFAHHRLRARALETPDIGIDELARGSLVHTLLEKFWEQTRSQEVLVSTTAEELDKKLDDCAALALSRLERERKYDFPPMFRKIEMSRLAKLARLWLEEEVKRTPFEVVEIEVYHQQTLGHLTIRTRIDRIDRLADGRFAVIDYKTGKVDVNQWTGTRLTEPQLPIYCIDRQPETLGAILFAVVRHRRQERGFRGLANTSGSWPTQEKALQSVLEQHGWLSFSDLCSYWHVALTALGDAFAAGKADVDPVNRRIACQFCDLVSLCRILELGVTAGAVPGDNDD